jgi:hypothetical protein
MIFIGIFRILFNITIIYLVFPPFLLTSLYFNNLVIFCDMNNIDQMKSGATLFKGKRLNNVELKIISSFYIISRLRNL